MRKRSSKKPLDLNQLAKAIADEATADVAPQPAAAPAPPADAPPPGKNPAAVALGKLGGKKGGPARAAKLTAKKRSEIASKAARARWAKKDHS
jgi:hypothetical protein